MSYLEILLGWRGWRMVMSICIPCVVFEFLGLDAPKQMALTGAGLWFPVVVLAVSASLVWFALGKWAAPRTKP